MAIAVVVLELDPIGIQMQMYRMDEELPGGQTWRDFAQMALNEDHADDDVTSRLLGDAANRDAVGVVRAEGQFVVAGAPLIQTVFQLLDPASKMSPVADEGAWVSNGDIVASVRAPAWVLLAGERTMLNYVQRLSGIATSTRRAVDAAAGSHTVITDTRKTTPGLRGVERYAVQVGGGVNHRFALHDAVLWKDNHWEMLADADDALAAALAGAPAGIPIQVEVENEQQLERALAAGVRFLLVDNQPPNVIQTWLERAGPDVIVEASGGITPDRVRAYVAAGVHRISIGALTHSPDHAPMGFEISIRG